MKTPLQIKGSDKTTALRICDANGKTLATINKSLGDQDYVVALDIINSVNRFYQLRAEGKA